MRWKVMVGTALFWAALNSALAGIYLVSHPVVYDPADYETWTDFRLMVFAVPNLPFTIPGLLLALLIEYSVMKPAVPQSPA